MKLWEVMKKLDENPNKRFKHELGSIIGFADNVLQWLEKDGEIIEPFCVRDRRSGTGICHNTGDDWQEVKQPVPWQEAILKFAKGSKVVVKLNEQEWALWALFEVPEYLDRAITNGEWYVED